MAVRQHVDGKQIGSGDTKWKELGDHGQLEYKRMDAATIITAYIPEEDSWEKNYRIRKKR